MLQLFGNATTGRPAVWKDAPDYRGSITILWSCLTTLILCVWTAVHLNLPAEDVSPKRRKWDPRGWITHQQWRRLGWLLIGLFAPEIVVLLAWAQRGEARYMTAAMCDVLSSRSSSSNLPGGIQMDADLGDQQLAACSASTGLSHDHIVLPSLDQAPNQEHDSGVHVPVHPDHNRSIVKPTPHIRSTSPERIWTHTHSFFAISGGFAMDLGSPSRNQNSLPGSRTRVTLNPQSILTLAQFDAALVPEVTQAMLEDKSKANAVVKVIICFQATWFMIEVTARLGQRLPISLLELNTFVHALSALLIYALWWDKPFDIEEPLVLQSSSIPPSRFRLYVEDGMIESSLGNAPSLPLRGWQAWHKPATFPWNTALPLDRIRNSRFLFFEKDGDYLKTSMHLVALAFCIGELMYGGLHLLAWDYPFYSSVHGLLWKISGLTIMASGPGHLLGSLGPKLIPLSKKLASLCQRGCTRPLATCMFKYVLFPILAVLAPLFALSPLFVLLYCFARAFIIVECFISFAYLPDGVFQQLRWSYYIPHVS